MGIVIKTVCQCVKKEKYFSLGVGMKDYRNPLPTYLGYCPICEEFCSVKDNELCANNHAINKVYTINMFENQIHEVICPRCNKMMQIEFAGLWD